MPKVRALDGKFAHVPFIAICKEIAPVADAEEDHGPKGLGVGDFQHKYFGGNDMYLDADCGFYKAMGGRTFSFGKVFKSPWWKPWAIWRELQEGSERLKKRGVEGNMRGIKSKASMLQGGVLVIGPEGQGVTFAHFEENDANVVYPTEEIIEGVKRMHFP